MGSQRRKFSSEFKDEAVRFVVNTGRPVATVAREIGIGPGWVPGRVNAGRKLIPFWENSERSWTVRF